MKRVIAGLWLGCQIGAGTGSLTALFVLLALAGNRNWNHDPAVYLTWGLWAAGIGFATGLFIGISIVVKQGRETPAREVPPKHCG